MQIKKENGKLVPIVKERNTQIVKQDCLLPKTEILIERTASENDYDLPID